MENRPRGLIFCRTGKMAEQIATDLQKIGVSIDPYHPGKFIIQLIFLVINYVFECLMNI